MIQGGGVQEENAIEEAKGWPVPNQTSAGMIRKEKKLQARSKKSHSERQGRRWGGQRQMKTYKVCPVFSHGYGTPDSGRTDTKKGKKN